MHWALKIFFYVLCIGLSGYLAYVLFRPKIDLGEDDIASSFATGKPLKPKKQKMKKIQPDAMRLRQQKTDVQFYYVFSPNCRYCQQVKPIAQRLQAYGLQPKVWTPALGKQFNIDGVPAFIKIRKGKLVASFAGPRTFTNILKWMQMKM